MLDPQRYQRAKSIFFEACEQPRDDRDAFVERACAGDADMQEAVQQLLSHDDDPLTMINAGHMRDHLERLAESSASHGESNHRDAIASSLPAHIGRYRILSRLGAGGMGVVYLAEQDNPRRQVALKVIAPGQASRQTLRRFEHEAQILGRLHHPGIAQVYEAGMHDSGEGAQPFFAMELVRGRALLKHCEEVKTDVRAKLELFIAICEAVQHAHQQGVIHRDLKPANILVDRAEGLEPICPNAQPKILDFGVARLTNSDVQVTTMHTAADQLIGTVAYMSPEQMSGNPEAIDTRSDVYALGVILFELLAGRLPHDVAGKTIPEMIRTVSEHEPTTLSSINRSYRGDLDTIVGKAMEREKWRRYQSAGELAADVRRYLRDEPIHARPPSTMYQFRKFTRRNKALVGGVAAVFIALVGGMITTAWQARQAIAARDEQIELRTEADASAHRAERAAAKANTIADVLQDMLRSASPHVNKGRDYTVRQMLDDFAAGDAEALRSEPDVRATVLLTMGEAYLSLGEVTAAGERLREAVDIRRDLVCARDDADLAEAIMTYGWWQHDRGDYAAAEQSMRESLAMLERLAAGRHSNRVDRNKIVLGDVLMHMGQFDESVSLLEEAAQSLRDAEDSKWLESALSTLAMTLQEMGRFNEAEPLLREALQLETAGDAAPTSAASITMGNLGVLLRQLGEYSESERLLRGVLDIERERLGEDHPRVAKAWNNLGLVLDDRNQQDEAEGCYRHAIAIHRTHPEYDNSNLASMLQNLGVCLANQQRFDEAEAPLRESVELTLAIESPSESDLALRRGLLGEILHLAGRTAEGEALAQEALDGLQRVLGEDHPSTHLARYRVGRMLLESNHFAEAERLLQPTFEAMMISPGPSQRDTVQAAIALADLRIRQRRYIDAEVCLVSVLQPAIDSLGKGHPTTKRAMALLVLAYGRQNKLADADRLMLEQIEWMRTAVAAPNDLDLADAIASVAISLFMQQKWGEAEPLLREAEAIMQANGSPQPMTAQMTWRLGGVVAAQSRFAEAEPLLLNGWEAIRNESVIDQREKDAAIESIVNLYAQWGKADVAAAWVAQRDQMRPATVDSTFGP